MISPRLALAEPTTNSDRFKYAFNNCSCLSHPLSQMRVEVFNPLIYLVAGTTPANL
jgi:hypothetical protein